MMKVFSITPDNHVVAISSAEQLSEEAANDRFGNPEELNKRKCCSFSAADLVG